MVERCGCDPGHDDCVCGCHCPHVERGLGAVQVLAAIPRGAHYVKCPCCEQRGWQTDDDDVTMVCPECMVEAVPTDD